MIQISVKSTDVRNQRGNAKASGKPYDLNFQTVYVHTFDRNGKPNPYPEKTEIILEKNEEGAALYYPVGEYTLDPRSFYVTRNGDLALQPRLVKMTPRRRPLVEGLTMDNAAREAMAEGALLALLFCFNSHQSAAKADRVTVSLTIGDDGVVYTDASYWAGDVPLGGQGF